MKKIAIIISPNWKDYAQKYLKDCLESVYQQTIFKTDKIKLFLMDNASTPDSLAYLSLLAPEAEILTYQKNEGFARPNNDALRLAREQGCEYFILVNMDTILAKDTVEKLVDYVEQHPRAGAVQARLMLWPDKQKINSLGNQTHFLGFGYSVGYQQKYLGKEENQEKKNREKSKRIKKQKNRMEEEKKITYPSGAGVLLTKDILKQVGFFDEELWMYNEDQDLGWRIWLAGKECLLAEQAVIYHKYSFHRSLQKYYWMDRNRLIVGYKNYHYLTLILLFPALIIMEMGLFFFAWRGGWWKEKIKVYQYFLKKETWQYLQQARKETQSLRKRKDREIVWRFSGKILYQEIDSFVLKIANFFFNLYWQIIKRLIIW